MKRLLKKANRLKPKNEKIRAALIVLLLAFLFELMPFVRSARQSLPENFGADECDCFCALAQRPWYGRVNPWFVALILFTPFMVFSIELKTSLWKRIQIIIITTAVSYILLNIAAVMGYAIGNAPFVSGITSHSTDLEKYSYSCVNIADGGGLAFSFLLGWIPVLIYIAFWFMIKRVSCFFKKK